MEDPPEVSPPAVTTPLAPAVYFLLHVRSQAVAARPPGVTRRAALWSPDFPPASSLATENPAIARTARLAHIHAAMRVTAKTVSLDQISSWTARAAGSLLSQAPPPAFRSEFALEQRVELVFLENSDA